MTHYGFFALQRLPALRLMPVPGLLSSLRLMPVLFVLLTTTPLQAEPGVEDLALGLSNEELLPGDTVDVIMTAGSVSDLQYVEFNLDFDAGLFTLDEMLPGSLFDPEAVIMEGELPDGRLGVAISNTTGPVYSDTPGSILILRFITAGNPPAGPFLFQMFDLLATDEDLDPLPVSVITDQAGGSILPYITDAGMTEPGSVSIARGSVEMYGFRLVAEGIGESDITQDNLLSADIGIVNLDELQNGGETETPAAISPGLFPESAWSPMDYTGPENGTHQFEAPFPFDADTGTWLVAGRFQLQDQSAVYAGYSTDGGGIWDGESYTTAEVTVTAQRVTLSHWSFDREAWTAGTGTFYNLGGTGTSDDSGTTDAFGITGTIDISSNFGNSGDSVISGTFGAGSPGLFGLEGASFNGWVNGSSGRAPNTNNWHPVTDEEDGEIEKYWIATLTSQGYGELRVSWEMNGSGTGPRDFRLEYRTGTGDGDTGSWQAVPGSEIQIPSSSSFTAFDVGLPDGAADAKELQIRWLRSGDAAIDGDGISTSGTNRIDNVKITGVPVDEGEMTVWPGKAAGYSQATTVNEDDVLAIGLYWMSQGPQRIPQNVSWAPQPVIRWIPEAAGHADTNGDGIVDHRDVMAIGRNFGSSVDAETGKIAAGAHSLSSEQSSTGTHSSSVEHSSSSTHAISGANSSDKYSTSIKRSPDKHSSSAKRSSSTILSRSLPKLEQGRSLTFRLEGEEIPPLLGMSARIHLTGIPGMAWSLTGAEPGDWADSWRTEDRLLDFRHNSDPDEFGHISRSVAWVHKGVTSPVAASRELLSFTITAEADWLTAPGLHIERIAIMDGSGAQHTPDAGKIQLQPVDEATDPPEQPQQIRLLPSYPNPFNRETVIRYHLPQEREVSLKIYDMLGRPVATLVRGAVKAGRHEVKFDADGMASGVYIYRLEVGVDNPSSSGHTTFTRKMTLLK